MLARILVTVAIVVALASGAWFCFRPTAPDRAVALREASEFFFQEVEDLEVAEELNARVLELIPDSAYDLYTRGAILERQGTPDSLREALSVYEKLLDRGDPKLEAVQLNRIRVLRRLGRLSEARALALSIADRFPVSAALELGRIALDRSDPDAALEHFDLALRVGESTDLQELRIRDAIASAYMTIARSGGSESEAARQRALAELSQLERRLIDFVEKSAFPERMIVWLVRVYEWRARVAPPGSTPYWHAHRQLDELVEAPRLESRAPSRRVRLLLGRLALLAAAREADLLEDVEAFDRDALHAAADAHFHAALGDRDEAREQELLNLQSRAELTSIEEGDLAAEPDPRLKARGDYVRNLIFTARAHLAGDRAGLLLEDRAPLHLASRLELAARSRDPSIAAVFQLVLGFAHAHAGDEEKATAALDRYLTAVPPEQRARTLLGLAEQCVLLLRESRRALTYLDRYIEQHADERIDLAHLELRVLLRARAREDLRDAAAKRLETLLARLSEATGSPAEALRAAEIVGRLSGTDAARKLLERASERHPRSAEVSQAWAVLTLEEAIESDAAASGNDSKEDASVADAQFRETITPLVRRFVADPATSRWAVRSLGLVLARLGEIEADAEFDAALAPVFPDVAPEHRAALTSAILAFSIGDEEEALERTEAIAATRSLHPLVPFLRGICHLERSRALRSAASSADAGSEAIELGRQAEQEERAAGDAFRRAPDSALCRTELAQLALRELDATADVPASLLAEIESLCHDPTVASAARWLLVVALEKRLQARAPGAGSDELASLTGRYREALRSVIRHDPSRTEAFVKLAQAILSTPDGQPNSTDATGDGQSRLGRAAALLESAPRPDTRLLESLATLLERQGEAERALVARLTTALLNPRIQTFSALTSLLLGAGELDAARWVLGDGDRDASPARYRGAAVDEQIARLRAIVDGSSRAGDGAVPALRAALGGAAAAPRNARLGAALALAREKWLGLPGREALGELYLGEIHNQLASQSRDASQTAAHRNEAIEHYERALGLFRDAGNAAPTVLLNNLAWLLAESDSTAKRERGVELAREALERTREPAVRQEIEDTLAWTLYRADRLEEALQRYAALVKQSHNSSHQYHYAQVLFAAKDYAGVLEQLRPVLDDTRFSHRNAAIELRDRAQEIRRRQQMVREEAD